MDGFPQVMGMDVRRWYPVSRQSNLVVETTAPHRKLELRSMLIEEAKKQGKRIRVLF